MTPNDPHFRAMAGWIKEPAEPNANGMGGAGASDAYPMSGNVI